AELWALVQESGSAAKEVALSDELHARIYPVTPGRTEDGVVLVIRRGVPRGLAVSAQAPALKLGPLEQAERDVIAETLAECGGNKTEAAIRLGLSRGTLYARLRRYRLS
ncbi:MAG: helix-turn-helix domain-containing protein, partial [Mycobacterium sp.]